MSELPWSKREIIDAMIAEYRRPDVANWDWLNDDHVDSHPFISQLRALYRLAHTGRGPPGFCVGLTDRINNKGDISPLEQEVFGRLGRVWQALHDSRNLDAAYEVPIKGEMN